ncbi:MAG: 3-oxoadipate enol-lactonase [Pseudomonadota bacterium]
MKVFDTGDVRLHYREDGDPDGAPLVFANSLGTDLRLWDAVVARLPAGLRVIRYDKRGHGLSDVAPGPYAMGALVRDAEALLDGLGVRDCTFVGLSIGGMIAQGLAAKRADLVGALVLSNTAAKIGTREIWQGRIAAIRAGGMAAVVAPTMERWFSRRFRAGAEITLWENMLRACPVEGYIGCSEAIAGTDFYTPTAALSLPTLGLAGSEDGSTPPDLVRETVALIEGARFEIMRGVGHLPCVEDPERYAALLAGFLGDTGKS